MITFHAFPAYCGEGKKIEFMFVLDSKFVPRVSINEKKKPNNVTSPKNNCLLLLFHYKSIMKSIWTNITH